MSDTFDHEADAWDEALFHDRDQEPPSGFPPRRRSYGSTRQLVTAIVKERFQESDKSWLMKIIVRIDSNRTLECQHWLPKKACQFQQRTSTILIPQWLVDRIAEEHEHEIQYNQLD